MTSSAAAKLITLVCALTAIGAQASGCSSANKPHLSGLGLGDSRIVSVGDMVTLRTPLTNAGAREWRVTSYDSRYLSLVSLPTVERDSSGNSWLVAQARAKLPGKTFIELSEAASHNGSGPRSVRYSVRIVE